VAWRLVDRVAPNSKLPAAVDEMAARLASLSDRPAEAVGVPLVPLDRTFTDDGVSYSRVTVEVDRTARRATVTLHGPETAAPDGIEGIATQGAQLWPLRLARELDDALCHLRLNERSAGVLIFKSLGDPALVLGYDALLEQTRDHWLSREIRLLWKRVLKRLDVTSRSLVTLVEPGSCFAGTLAEIVLAADRSIMLAGALPGDNRPAPTLVLGAMNFGAYPMPNDLTRLATRFIGEPQSIEAARERMGQALSAEEAETAGLVTFAYDHVDWADEVRIFLEERASFSADSLTGLEANLRFAGPETMETKIFGRLKAWQNWIFQRPNAAGGDGALKRYGSGVKASFDPERT
jgi:benzoyl-CoA-dihydrodiol lyase